MRRGLKAIRASQSLAILIACLATAPAWGQSSSLYVESIPATQPATRGQASSLSPSLAAVSLMAVQIPEPRQFAVHDLVTIVVRESTSASSEARLDTAKDFKQEGAINAFPNLQLKKLLEFQLSGSKNENPAELDLEYNGKFQGDGSYRREDSTTFRITAEIIDIKPNGTVVLEAHKFTQSDKETLKVSLTGTCRSEDIAADNTVLSTQLANLNLNQEHAGELRNASKKGLLTKFFETLFNF